MEKTIEQIERITGAKPKDGYVDRGYKKQEIRGTKVIAPSNGVGLTKHEKSKLRKAFRRRAAIEPIIGHTKSDYGMDRNYLKSEGGDSINAMLAASAFNFRSWMRKALEQLIFALKYLKQIWHQFTINPETDALRLAW